MGRSGRSGKSKPKSAKPKCACGLEKEVGYSGSGVQYPVFSCPECGPDKVNEWERWWDKYSGLWKDPANWEEKKHHVSCMVGFMCAKFHEFYGHPYKFSFRSPVPFKDKAFTMARRILALFDGDARRAANYVKWAFHFKVRSRNYPITSFGFFASEKFVLEYEHARARAAVLRRSTPLPEEFLVWCRGDEAEIFELQELATWDDLNGLVTHVKCYGADNTEGRVVNEAVKRGMLPAGPEYKKLEN